MSNIKVRSWIDVDYDDPDSDFVEIDKGTVNDEPSMTQQHFSEEVDINNIIERYGGVPVYGDSNAMYGDFSEVPSFSEYQQILIDTRQKWGDLPLEVRNNFSGPIEFLRFVDDPSNKEAFERMFKVNSPAEPVGGSEVPPTPGSSA